MWTSYHPRRPSTWSLDEEAGDGQNATARLASSPPFSRIDPPSSPEEQPSKIRAGEEINTDRRTTRSRIGSSAGHFGLWPLQIGRSSIKDAKEQRGEEAFDAQRSALVSSISTISSSPGSSRHGHGTERTSSASPPSPFAPLPIDDSPLSTPPDTATVLADGSILQRRAWDPFVTKDTTNPVDGVVSQLRRASLVQPESKPTALVPQVQISAPPKQEGGIPRSTSRNDIFSTNSPVMQPAPRLPSCMEPTAPGQPPVRTGSQKSTTRPRNSSFFDAPSPSIPAARPLVPHDAYNRPRTGSLLSIDDGDRPNYGRSNTEERERERERIRRTNREVDFRLCPVKELLLGEGRHSDVYSGAFRARWRGAIDSNHDEDDADDGQWRLCAMKRPHADRQSQLLALEEAFALRRLGPHPNVIRLIKIRDEVQFTSSNPATDAGTTRGAGVEASEGQGGSSAHARSTSDSGMIDKDAETNAQQSNGIHHRRMVSQPDQQPSSGEEQMPHTPTVRDMTSDQRQQLRQSQHGTEPPRLLMLLELLPFSLSSFSRRNPELLDFVQWRMWALELAGVVEWMHGRGCVHADLKPENVLLTSDLHVKICDFNSALFPSANTPLLDGIGLGTPAYGAPELSRNIRGPADTYKGFSFPVDIWSLGAILYTLATGVEPFRRARSTIDMLYRKRVFFESEENDRAARLSVAEGSSTAGPPSHYGSMASTGQGSLPASRKGSLRGTRRQNDLVTSASGVVAAPTGSPKASSMRASLSHKRSPSAESIASSIASSSMVVSSSSGMRPSTRAINMLLDESTPIGVLPVPGTPQLGLRILPGVGEARSPRMPSVFADVNGHHRASSMGKTHGHQYVPPQQRLQPRSSHAASAQASPRPSEVHPTAVQGGSEATVKTHLAPVMRPEHLRRTTSYNGQTASANVGGPLRPVDVNHAVHNNDLPGTHSADTSMSSNGEGDNTDLRLAVAAAFARSSGQTPQPSQAFHASPSTSLHPSSYTTATREDEPPHQQDHDDDMMEDLRPYRDGTPALILPGGGRLPDEARRLLERMLRTEPDERPTATEVRRLLEAM